MGGAGTPRVGGGGRLKCEIRRSEEVSVRKWGLAATLRRGESAMHLSKGEAFWQRGHPRAKSFTVSASIRADIFLEIDWLSVTSLAGGSFITDCGFQLWLRVKSPLGTTKVQRPSCPVQRCSFNWSGVQPRHAELANLHGCFLHAFKGKNC